MGIGSFGRVRVFEDFLGAPDVTTGGTTALTRVCGLTQLAVGAPTLAQTVDEPGGVLSIQTGATDDNNCVLYAGPFKPADGGCVIEARFKCNSASLGAIYCGFSETLATTPVMPAESATTALTINGSGGMAGMLWDPDRDTDDWVAVAGDGGAVASDLATATGTVSGQGDLVADEWDIVRVELDVNGDAKIYHDGALIDDVKACVTASDVQHAILMVEARSAVARIMEVDFFYAEGGRDWTV